jgi:hypothetical protein
MGGRERKEQNQTTARKHGTLWYIKNSLDQTLQGLRVLKTEGHKENLQCNFTVRVGRISVETYIE